MPSMIQHECCLSIALIFHNLRTAQAVPVEYKPHNGRQKNSVSVPGRATDNPLLYNATTCQRPSTEGTVWIIPRW